MDLIKEYVVEHAKELGVLTVDLILFGISSYAYNKQRHNINCIQESKLKGENAIYKYSELKNNRTYGLVKGTVTPIDRPLSSLYDNSINGVVQKLTISEHVTSRSRYGFWGDHTRVLHEKNNTSSFCLVNDKFKIVVQDALCANKLDMNITYDKFEPSNASVMDLILIIASGSRERGKDVTNLKIEFILLDFKSLRKTGDSHFSLVLTY